MSTSSGGEKESDDAANQMMLQIGVVELSSSPWASPIALVRKKDGSTRFCVDYPQLNATAVKDS